MTAVLNRPKPPMSDRVFAVVIIAGGICSNHILDPQTVTRRAYAILDELEAEDARRNQP